MEKILKILEKDNVAVALFDLSKGEEVGYGVVSNSEIPAGHKIALFDIKEGENIIKYGYPIGHALCDIHKGEHIHTHNLKTNLNEVLEYKYNPENAKLDATDPKEFLGYTRDDGKVGIRNEIWVIPTVGCVNKTAEIIANMTNKDLPDGVDGVYAYTHPYGCSQLGNDHITTQKILADLANHPNAAGVLIVGLGCENNSVASFKELLGDYSEDRIKFIITQDEKDEIEAGIEKTNELIEYAKQFKRTPHKTNELIIGLKCGGSDAFSGITANPLIGKFSDILISQGGSTILTEVPEMFGAEQILMDRCENKELFDKTVSLINNFKQYFIDHNQPIYENPSPGNKKGGISTLEDKSLGCTQKCGAAPVLDVLLYAEQVKVAGLNLLESPGNDIVASTALTAAGAHLILFSTGRGTPFGVPAPTIKISSNSKLANQKSNWIDFDAGVLLDDANIDTLANKFFDFIIDVANGSKTKNEQNGYREIAIFKNGITL